MESKDILIFVEKNGNPCSFLIICNSMNFLKSPHSTLIYERNTWSLEKIQRKQKVKNLLLPIPFPELTIFESLCYVLQASVLLST